MAEDTQKKDWHNETRMLSELVPYDKNPRKITEEDQKRLKKSFKNTGYAESIAIDTDNVIVAGHQRYEILKQLNKKDIEIDVRVPPEKLTEQEFKDYLIASNKDTGEWDYVALAEEFTAEELLDKGFDTEDFKDVDVEQVETEGDDEVPEPPEEPKTVKGDIYELGDHRLLCGDCTEQTSSETLLQENKVDSLVTDPPYGVDYSSKNEMLNAFDKGNCCQRPIKNDHIENYREFFASFLSIIPFADYNTIYIFMSGNELHNVRIAFDDCKIKWGDYLVWVKNNHVLGRKDYNSKYEFCVYGWAGVHKFHADGHRTTVLEYDKPTKNDLHPTMKPIALIEQLVTDGSGKNAIIFDPFGGSGSTLIACEKTKRRCYMMELDPKYCDVIVKRYKEFCEKNDKVAVIKRNGEVIEKL